MQREWKGSFYYLLMDLRYSFLLFWSILLGVLLLSIGFDIIFGSEDGVIGLNFSIPIYIFGAIFAYYLVKNTLPYLIKQGGTRKVILPAVGIHLIAIALVNSIIANIIISILNKVYSRTFSGIQINNQTDNSDTKEITMSIGSGGETTSSDGSTMVTISHFNDLFMDSTWLTRIFFDLSITFFFMVTCFILALFFYRYGIIGGVASIAVVIFVMIHGAYNGWLEQFVIFIFEDFNYTFFYQLFAVGLLLYVLSYSVLWRMPIRDN